MTDQENTQQKKEAAQLQQLQQDYQQLAHEYRLLSVKYARLESTLQEVAKQHCKGN